MKRWIPTGSMLLVSLISYIDRNTLALLAPTILKDTHLTATEYTLVIAAFSLTYTLGNPIWGRALDRLGVRVGMLLAVAVWTAASVSHAFAMGLLSFAAARALLGFGEGATFPGGLRTVAQTLPENLRARGLAVAYSGGSLGAIITPLVVTPIALAWGWRGAFWFTGLVGAAWLVVWLVVSRRPEIRVRPKLMEAGLSLKDRRVWGYMLAYAFGAFPIGFVIYITSIYLNQAWGKSQAEIGRALWIPPVGWEAGYFFWGWLSDRACRRAADPVVPLRKMMAAAAALSLPLALTPWAPSFGWVMAELFVAMFLAGGFIILSVAYATRTYSAAHSGLIAGLGAGAWSAGVTVILPGLGKLVDLHMFPAVFLISAVLPAVGFGAWWWASGREREGYVPR